MKLKLEELLPYLLYDLKVMDLYDNKERFFTGYSINHTEPVKVSVRRNELSSGRLLSEVKPILKPLSDLNTKYGENEVNEHFINTLIEKKYKLDYGVFSHYKGFLHIELDGDLDLRYDSNKCIDFDVIFEIQKQLFKNHYDVFGLIEKGLAIDINTLK
jgi:hypothetical protein